MEWQSRREFLRLAITLPGAATALYSQNDTTFRAEVKVVNLFATVRDAHGKIVPDLTKDDFILDEDGHPQTIRYFARESGLPLTLGLLVDTSGSQRRVLGDERAASYRFLDQMLRDTDRAFVIHFDSEVELLQDLTSSHPRLERALAELDSIGGQFSRPRGRRMPRGGWRNLGGTELYDSVLLACDEIMKNQTGRKALILLTDGVDVGSRIGLNGAVQAAQLSDTLVYGIRFADPDAYSGRAGRRRNPTPPPYVYGDRLDGAKTLQRISGPTGGTFFDVAHDDTLDKIFDQIQEELRNQYSIGYTSDRTDAGRGYRRIHLASKRAGLTVRTRDGYYVTN